MKCHTPLPPFWSNPPSARRVTGISNRPQVLWDGRATHFKAGMPPFYGQLRAA